MCMHHCTEIPNIYLIRYIDGCTTPVNPTNAVLYNASISSDSMSVVAPGKTVTITCEFILSFHLLTCQDNGLWYPEPGNISCPSELSNTLLRFGI